MTRGFKRKELHYSIGICTQVGTRGIYGQSCFVLMSIWIIDNCLYHFELDERVRGPRDLFAPVSANLR